MKPPYFLCFFAQESTIDDFCKIFVLILFYFGLYILYDLGAKKNISGVYCSSSDLQFSVSLKSKMDAILHIYYKNNDVILDTKQIKACYNIL